MQLPAVQRTVHSRKQYLGSVKIKNSLALTGLRRYQPDILTLGKTPACFFQILRKHTEHLIPLTLQLIHARINAAHKNIRRTAALIDSQKTLQFFPAHTITAQVDHPRLGQTGQRLMHTVDHHIRTKLRRRHRKIIRKPKMRPVSFIHDQRHTIVMRDLRDPRHIRHDPVISRRSDQHRLDLRIFRQIHFHTAG